MTVGTLVRPSSAVAPAVRRWPVAVALLVLAGLAVLAVLPLVPPSPAGPTAPADAFSATRAYQHIAAIARAPRPTGSLANAQARAYLVQTLSGLGLSPTVVTRSVCRANDGETTCGVVTNVQATLHGRNPTGTVMLVGHYDSAVDSPGASDDGLAVATLLETARALLAGPRPRNDVLFLFPDGEEPGLLGSTAAVDGGDLPPAAHTVVLNMGALGHTGPAVMFQTGGHDTALLPALGGRHGIATSLAATVYGFIPNDTDFSEFRQAGMNGMDFAVIEGSASQDNGNDTLAAVDRGSLQDLGDMVLSAGRALAGADLAGVDRGGADTYFPVAGLLVRYPQAIELLVAGLAVLGVAGALWYARRRVGRRLGRAGLAAGGFAGALVASAAVGYLGWQLLLLARPDYVGFVYGEPYRPGPAYLGLAVVTVGLVAGWWGLIRRRVTALDCAAGLAGILALLTVAAAVAVPHGAYLVAWPALAMAVGVAVGAGSRPGSPWRVLVWALPTAVALLVLAPVVVLLFPALGLAGVWVALAGLALLAGTVLAALPVGAPRPRVVALVTAVALVAGVGLVGAGTVRDRVDAGHPRLMSMVYAIDSDTGTATWLSPYPAPDAFIDRYVTAPGRPWTARFPVLHSPRYRSGTARVVPVPAPTVQVLADTAGTGVRQVRLQLAADRPGATSLDLYVDTGSATVVSARVAGRPVPGGRNRAAADQWHWGFTFVGPTTEGVEVDLTLSGPARLLAVAATPGLPAPALDGPMPATRAGAISAAVQTLATRTVTV